MGMWEEWGYRLQNRWCFIFPRIPSSSISINSKCTAGSGVKTAHAALMGELSESKKASGLDWRCSWKYPDTTNSEKPIISYLKKDHRIIINYL